MAQKKGNFESTTPRGSVFTSRDENGSVTAKIEWAPDLPHGRQKAFPKRNNLLIQSAMRYMNPLTPETHRYDDQIGNAWHSDRIRFH